MSGSIRLFVESPLEAGAEAAGSAAQAHYLGNVMRRAVGAEVRLFNGVDGEWQARIASLKSGRAVFAVEAQERAQAAGPDLWLVFALLKRDATDLVARMATELGVSALLPVTTERTNAARTNLDRLTAIAIEAAEQCERLTVPEVRPPVALNALLRNWAAERALYAALERETPERRPVAQAARPGPAALLTGPEGGFTGRELDAMGRCAFVVPVSLGPLILRAETASVSGLTLLLASRAGTESVQPA
ncbi:MAG: 16S rRNA (uracil(1498)-N(3))-methyltransferase [Proteobacteria bacterium]|nr:16S rRNA (uracil(1498)-N(3))-methyltransferase [Pseudomonadota bacterium]